MSLESKLRAIYRLGVKEGWLVDRLYGCPTVDEDEFVRRSLEVTDPAGERFQASRGDKGLKASPETVAHLLRGSSSPS